MPASIIQKHWKIRTPNPLAQRNISDQLNIHPIVAQLLINRGVNTPLEAKEFLFPDLDRLYDPFLLKDMDKTVARIFQAREKRERVLVFGDYDVDGVTSSALLHKGLTRLGIEVITHIPHRMEDGYGLNVAIGQVAKEQGVSLLISVDCGVTAVKEVEAISALGIDVMILDHHEPSDEGLPAAYAVVDPKRADCRYPFKHLASVGLVCKLLQALFKKVPEEDLDLVALGTIADVVPLRGENRILVKKGLPLIGFTKNKGLAALIDIAKLKGKEFKPHFVGFVLGPRINATGRMDSAQKSLDLLLAQSDAEAYTLARHLEELNNQRQQLQREVIQEVQDLMEEEFDEDNKVLVLCKEGWHKGVLGIVASRVVETHYRPTVIISFENGKGTASCRSIEGFHLNEALAHCGELLENFGGHKLAAGMTILEENVEQFKRMINNFAKDIVSAERMVPTIEIDCEVSLAQLNLRMVELTDGLEPFGQNNPAPVFASRKLTVKSHPSIVGRDTLKFWVTDGVRTVSVVGFGKGKYKGLIGPGKRIDLAYQLMIDDWNKAPTVQLKLVDLKVSQ